MYLTTNRGGRFGRQFAILAASLDAGQNRSLRSLAMSRIQSSPRDFRARLRHLGPGLIITASIVGSGELIVTTKLGAELGFTLLWFIILGCMIKVLLQVE